MAECCHKRREVPTAESGNDGKIPGKRFAKACATLAASERILT
jgi:hypothetical protein